MTSIAQVRADIRSLRYELTPSAVAEILDTLGGMFALSYSEEHHEAIALMDKAAESLDYIAPERVAQAMSEHAKDLVADARRSGM